MELTGEDISNLKKMYDHQCGMPEYEQSIGWTWLQVGVYSATVNRLLVMGYVELKLKTRSGTNYLLTGKGVAAAESGAVMLELSEKPGVVNSETILLDTSDMFSDIIGYDNVKELLRESLQLEKPIHVLLHGPPSLAKSMFLWDIERVYGHLCVPLIGSATSHAGMWDLIAQRKPKIVLIDELEKMSITDLAGLLSLMEKGRIIRTKVGREMDEQLTCWVIGTANRITRLPTELLSRFSRQQLSEYNAAEYTHVVKSVLMHHEGTNAEDAYEIAMRLVGATHDVRDAVRVARLSKRVGTKRAIELLVS